MQRILLLRTIKCYRQHVIVVLHFQKRESVVVEFIEVFLVEHGSTYLSFLNFLTIRETITTGTEVRSPIINIIVTEPGSLEELLIGSPSTLKKARK